MMATYKITDDFYDDSFTLLALHSSMEDYAMVYALNSCLKTRFKRASKDLELSNQISFPVFEWKDEQNDNYWSLIINNSIQEESLLRSDLFENVPSFSRHHLVPEYKDADYLLKIEHDENSINKSIVRQLQTVPQIITAYIIEVDNLKSKSNLIF